VTTLHPFEGLPNGDERFAKVQLAYQINLLLEERGLKQKEAAELLRGFVVPATTCVLK